MRTGRAHRAARAGQFAPPSCVWPGCTGVRGSAGRGYRRGRRAGRRAQPDATARTRRRDLPDDHVRGHVRPDDDDRPRVSTVRERHHGRAEHPGAGTYWGANVATATGEDRYAGWSLIIASRDPSLPLRNLTVFDGFSDVGQGDPETVNISGFLAPLAGAVDTQLGTVTWEGDASSSGDRVRLGTTTLATTLSQGTNFFNSTVDRNGCRGSPRTPLRRQSLRCRHKGLRRARHHPERCDEHDGRTGVDCRAVLHRRRDHGDQPVLARLHDEHEGGRQPERPRPLHAGQLFRVHDQREQHGPGSRRHRGAHRRDPAGNALRPGFAGDRVGPERRAQDRRGR